jgi:hypothetical protein
MQGVRPVLRKREISWSRRRDRSSAEHFAADSPDKDFLTFDRINRGMHSDRRLAWALGKA